MKVRDLEMQTSVQDFYVTTYQHCWNFDTYGSAVCVGHTSLQLKGALLILVMPVIRLTISTMKNNTVALFTVNCSYNRGKYIMHCSIEANKPKTIHNVILEICQHN